MKKAFLLLLFFVSVLGFSQQQNTVFEKEGNLVKATYYYNSGEIKTQGFFKNKKLTGTWTSFDKAGNKTQIAQYFNGKKVGKWFIWEKENLREITYNNNVLINVNELKSEYNIASSND